MQVHVVLVALQSPGVVSNALYRGDMIFQDEEPMLVLEWSGARGASDPVVSAKLQRDCLVPAGPEKDGADFLHEFPVNYHRPLQPGHV